MANKYDIFISYRRVGGAQYARILQLMLIQRGYKVFLDYDELTDGKFGDHIKSAVKDAPTFMLVLSKGALDRCKNDGDWVRREIQLAISGNKQIIPINPDDSFDRIPEDIPDDIKDVVSTHQHSFVYFGQTLGDNVDSIVKNRLVPKIGERLRQDSDPMVLRQRLEAEDKARKRHRMFIKVFVAIGVLCAVGIIGIIGNSIKSKNDKELHRKNLMAQVESHHPGLNFMSNDSITVEQLKVIDDIFNNLRDVYGDSIQFGAFETTVKEYYTILGKDYDKSKSSLPITEVSFGRALQFINKLNEFINSDATNMIFSLPNKEEWEYAASDGNIENATLYAGSDNIDEVAWYNTNSNSEPHPADGQNELMPNQFGLYDMSGNVEEIVFPSYTSLINGEIADNSVYIKGGSFVSSESECLIKSHTSLGNDLSSPRIGFRLVLRKKDN